MKFFIFKILKLSKTPHRISIEHILKSSNHFPYIIIFCFTSQCTCDLKCISMEFANILVILCHFSKYEHKIIKFKLIVIMFVQLDQHLILLTCFFLLLFFTRFGEPTYRLQRPRVTPPSLNPPRFIGIRWRVHLPIWTRQPQWYKNPNFS